MRGTIPPLPHTASWHHIDILTVHIFPSSTTWQYMGNKANFVTYRPTMTIKKTTLETEQTLTEVQHDKTHVSGLYVT
jgi:hypothetical protein